MPHTMKSGTGDLTGGIRRQPHHADGSDSNAAMTHQPSPLTKYFQAAAQEGQCGPSEVIALLTLDIPDRDNEVILPGGAVLDHYRTNPVVMYGHAKGRPEEGEAGLPIGRNVWIKPTRDGHGLIGKHVFDLDDAFSLRVCSKAKNGFLNTYSITFLPIEWGPPTAEEIRARPDWKNVKCVYRRWELIEYSIVAVPANPAALTLAKRGNTMDEFVSVTAEATATAEPEEKAMGENVGVLGGLAVPDEDVEEENVRKSEDKNTGVDEPEPDPEDIEEEERVKRGDHVKCKAPHCKGYGVVKSVHKGEMVPDTEDDVYGSKASPACRVQLYKKMGDGYTATEHHRGMLCKHVEKCDMLKPPSKKKVEKAASGWTDAQKAAYKAALMESPEYKARMENAVTYQLAIKAGKA
jgi:hypothetical protein